MEIDRDEIERENMRGEELLAKYTDGERDFSNLHIWGSFEVSFKCVNLSGINLENSFLHIDFSGAILKNANFRQTIWCFGGWEDIDFTGSDFTQSQDSNGSFFIRCNLSNTIWTQVDFWQTCFVGCIDDNAEFEDIDWYDVSFISEKKFYGD